MAIVRTYPNDNRRRHIASSASLVITTLLSLGTAAPSVCWGDAAVETAETQPAPSASQLEEITVTAQKREQSINTVPMSITAVTGDQLQVMGIEDVSDLAKITPGLTAGKSNVGSPVFTLRGVGYNDVAIAARPAVTVYLDESPITFSDETKGVGFDVERVEVLKGPQGTLFGNNSTGGAVNYIANKPTNTYEAGGTLTYGRFSEMDIESYFSGPLSDTLSARVAVEHEGRGDWQESYTRHDTIGKKDFTNARFTLLWKPSDDLRSTLTLSGWVDRSDTEQTQVINVNPQVPVPAIINLTRVPTITLAPHNDRAADWVPGTAYQNNTNYEQASERLDYDLSSHYTLTSLTNFSRLNLDYLLDAGGTNFEDLNNAQFGDATSYSEELRIAGNFDRLNAIVGTVYAYDRSHDTLPSLFPGNTLAYAFTAYGAPLWTSLDGYAGQTSRTYAGFGNLEYKATSQLTLQGGLRFTQYDLNADMCSRDNGDGNAATVISDFADAVRAGAGLPPVARPAPGACVSLFSPSFEPGEVVSQLNQNNVSWRSGIQYQPVNDTMLYANVSKGYKGGAFSPFGTTTNASYQPAVQESVLAYEAGFKAGLLDRAVELNGAVFYYDYRNKQVLGNFKDPYLGTIAGLVNIPKSKIEGAEFQVMTTPFRGLTLMLAGTVVKSEVLGNFTGSNADQVTQNFEGTMLPYAPEFVANANVRYEWPLNGKTNGFTGVNESYQSHSYAYLGEVPLIGINAYALTDLQAGIEGSDGKWRAYLWGRNVFDTYYWTAAARELDTSARWAGMPATFGVTFAVKFP